MNLPLADLSLDLDNKWSYLKTRGVSSWEQFPTYLPTLIPLVLSLLERCNLKITVFVVGQDAEREENLPWLRQLAEAGHEIGNHSFHHEPWLQRYSDEQLEQEFDLAESAISKITTQALLGFRGPGYSLSPSVLDLLARRNYLYDCSTLPTYLGPVARAYYFLNTKLSASQSKDRQKLFGTWREWFRPINPYNWRTSSGSILEIPVSTVPFFKTPFHFSYLLFLAQRSSLLAMSYFRFALSCCAISRTSPSMLLHPLDFLGNDDVQGLEFFPAMSMPGSSKRAFIGRALEIYTRRYRVVPMFTRAQELLQDPKIKLASRNF